MSDPTRTCDRCGKDEAAHNGTEKFCPFISTFRADKAVSAPVEYEGLALALANTAVKSSTPSDEPYEPWTLPELRKNSILYREWLAVAKRAEEWFVNPRDDGKGLATFAQIRERARLGEE
jgi:hypothetical protein